MEALIALEQIGEPVGQSGTHAGGLIDRVGKLRRMRRCQGYFYSIWRYIALLSGNYANSAMRIEQFAGRIINIFNACLGFFIADTIAFKLFLRGLPAILTKLDGFMVAKLLQRFGDSFAVTVI